VINNYTIKKQNLDKIYLIIIFLSILIFSYLFSPYYTEGDQIPYNNAYLSVKGENIIDAFLHYQFNISSQEPIHFFIDWIFSNIGVTKNLIMSCFNGLLALSISYLMLMWQVNFIVILATIFFNFYILVLYFAAERLKFGFLFLIIACIFHKNKIKNTLLILLSISSHVQILIYVLATTFSTSIIRIIDFLKNLKFKSSFKNIVISIIFLLLIYYLYDHILSKFIAYSNNATGNSLIGNIWQTIIFMIGGIYYSKKRLNTFLNFIFILICSSILGPERITMMSYFLFLFFALQYKNGINFGIFLTTIYFSFKSIYFIQRILENGHGF
jgi:hypothetical protein